MGGKSMKRNKFKLALLISLTIFFGGFTAIYLYNNNNLLKDSVVDDLESFSEELKISVWNWTSTEVVSTESTGYSYEPTIATDGSGNAHVTWEDDTDYGGSGTDRDIFYKRWSATTAAWTTTEVVSTESTAGSFRPTIATDGSGNVHIAWYDDTDYSGSGADVDIFYKRRNATTAAWTTTEVVSTESTADSYYPTIATDGSGNAHIAWQDYTDYGGSGSDADVFYKRWNATTAAWTTTEVVSTESTAGSYEPTIATDGSGNAHVAWYDYTDYGGSGADPDIFYKRWSATTAAWTTTEVVSTESTAGSFRPTIATDGSGNAHIAWDDGTDYGGSGTDEDVFYKRRNATTAVWTTTEVVSTESTAGSFSPTIATDGSGNAHIAWEDGTDYGGSGTDYDIFYKKFTSTPLNPSIIINNGDASTNSTLVTLALSADGATEMCFRNGTTGAWTDWEPYATAKQLYLEGTTNNTEYSICVKFRNAIGETSPVCDSILYTLEKVGEEGPPFAIIVAIIAAIAGGGLAVSITTILLIRKRRRKVQ